MISYSFVFFCVADDAVALSEFFFLLQIHITDCISLFFFFVHRSAYTLIVGTIEQIISCVIVVFLLSPFDCCAALGIYLIRFKYTFLVNRINVNVYQSFCVVPIVIVWNSLAYAFLVCAAVATEILHIYFEHSNENCFVYMPSSH